MTPLEPLPLPGLILSFDFDGTLHHPGDTPPVSPRLFETLRRLRREKAALWGINTGRSIAHVVEGLAEGGFPFAPDWIVAREREVWLPDAAGRWVPHEPWNRQCERDLAKFFKEARTTLDAIRREVEEHTGATWIEQPGDPAGLIARTEEEMAWIIGRVEALAAGEPRLGWQRNSIWLRFGHRNYQKGSSLTETARHFGLVPAHVFAIGDSHNDFEMLHPSVAAKIACPGNSVAEIRAHVLAHGGYACRNGHSGGCVEALEHFFGPAAE
jgi:hydroxymethylpyrimidine pyrophosphatase-like HAD family hydrolase